MYKLDKQEFLELISTGLKHPVTEEDIFSPEIKISHLKRIDKVFEKGLHYYLDPGIPEPRKEASIFFRKQHFTTDDLNIGAVKVVNRFEELKLSISAMAKLSGISFERKFPKYTVRQNPERVASEIRKVLYPAFQQNKRDFLKSLIASAATHNILVFEFVETWNKREKANIDGFYLKPNMIVLKRHQAFRREIFTLAHELGHYLLEKEEIEELDVEVFLKRSLNKVERWCNDFAYFFLAGEYDEVLSNLDKATPANDYHHDTIKRISDNTHLSTLALYTRLLFQKKLDNQSYRFIKQEIEEKVQKRQQEKEAEKQRLKELGLKPTGSAPKPILSPLYVSTVQAAYYEGILNEFEVCKKLNIKPEKLEQVIQ